MGEIQIKDISKAFDQTQVLNNIDLDIPDGSFTIILGPSGCGKSTLLRILSGLETSDGGEIWISGKDVTHAEPKDRQVAMVFQNYALYPHMTVFENMAFGLKLRKVPKDEIKRKVEEVAGILDITHLLNRKPKALSGGQRQRVALGRAMVRNPDVFLLDEPLSNLDAKLRTTMRSEIIKLHRRLDATFVYVTHDQTEAMTMGDRIVVMKDGHIQQVDTPQRLFNFPANVFVAGFIGSPQMNFINSKVVKYENKYFIEFSGSLMSVPQRFMDKIKDYENKEVIMGVRPEDIIIEEKSEVKASVDIMEVMGSEAYVYLKLNDGSKLIAKTGSGVNFNVGDEVGIKANPDKIHIFDKETEKSILL